MMSKQCCGNCKFWEKPSNIKFPDDCEKNLEFSCRRYPPCYSYDGVNRFWAHPNTDIGDWCGEWMLKKFKIGDRAEELGMLE